MDRNAIGRQEVAWNYRIESYSKVVRRILNERLEAIEEIVAGQAPNLVKLRTLLKNLPDLVRGLSRIQYGKVNTMSAQIFMLNRPLEHSKRASYCSECFLPNSQHIRGI